MIGIGHIVVAHPDGRFDIYETCPWTLALAKRQDNIEANVRSCVAKWPAPEHVVHSRAEVDAILAQGDTHYEVFMP